MAGSSNPDLSRPAIAVSLSEPEQSQVVQALEDAGFDTLPIAPKGKISEAFSPRTPRLIAIVDVAGDPAGAVRRAAEARRGRPGALAVVFTVDPGELDGLEKAGLDEADEILLRPFDIEALRWRVEAMAIRAQVPVTDGSDAVLAGGQIDTDLAPSARVFAVFNPKGGVGKTTIATNLASALQLHRSQKVLLIDADTVTGHVTTSLGLEQVRTVADSWRDQEEGGPVETLIELAAPHPSGLTVVSLTSSPLNTEILDPARVADAIATARPKFDFIVVDLHPSYSSLNMAIFERADRILVPVTPDVPALRAAVQLRDVAIEVGIQDRLALIVNRANSGVSVADMERTVGMSALALIRSGGLLFVRAANSGRTIIEMFPRERITEDFDALADRLVRTHVPEASTPTATKAGFRLFGRSKEPARA
jgi:pilus assembly protein CpaE